MFQINISNQENISQKSVILLPRRKFKNNRKDSCYQALFSLKVKNHVPGGSVTYSRKQFHFSLEILYTT